MNQIIYICPVCKIKNNISNVPFASFRAVSLHIAGKVKANDVDHKYWAWENCGQEQVNNAVKIARATGGINVIGDLLILPVKAWHDEHGKANIGFRK